MTEKLREWQPEGPFVGVLDQWAGKVRRHGRCVCTLSMSDSEASSGQGICKTLHAVCDRQYI